MCKWTRVLVGLAVVGFPIAASAQPRTRPQSATLPARLATASKPRTDARVLRIGNLATGEIYETPTVGVRTQLFWGFNSMNGSDDRLPDAAFEYGENVNYSWANGSGHICDFNDPNAFVYLAIDPISADTCVDPNDFGYPTYGFDVYCAAWDIRFDNYICDVAEWGGDPNNTRAIYEVGVVLGYDGNVRQVARVFFGFFERFDRNGDGFYCSSDGGPYFADVDMPGGGQYWVRIPWQTIGTYVPGTGFFMIDVADTLVDPNTGQDNGREACGYYLAVAGGVAYAPECPTPSELLSAGSSYDPYVESDWCFMATGYADNNCAEVDPGIGCDPNVSTTTYGDIWHHGDTTGGGMRRMQPFDPVSGYNLAAGFCWRIASEPNELDFACVGDIGGPGGCGTRDGVVDITDLGCLLGDYGSPSSGTGVGDIGGPGGCGSHNADGVTDLTDLGCLLGAYGPCP